MTERVLAIVAHFDDEAIMCGGTLAKHGAAGDEVRVMFFTNSVGARADYGFEQLQARAADMREALMAIGITFAYEHTYRDNAMDSVPRLDIVRNMEEAIAEYQPTTVYTHFHADVNVDHRRVSDCVSVACRPQPGSSVRRILMGEVRSSTEWQLPGRPAFQPTVFIDVSDVWPKKNAALECYASEMREYPHARSMQGVIALAQLRGSTVGVRRAEAFMLAREIA